MQTVFKSEPLLESIVAENQTAFHTLDVTGKSILESLPEILPRIMSKSDEYWLMITGSQLWDASYEMSKNREIGVSLKQNGESRSREVSADNAGMAYLIVRKSFEDNIKVVGTRAYIKPLALLSKFSEDKKLEFLSKESLVGIQMNQLLKDMANSLDLNSGPSLQATLKL